MVFILLSKIEESYLSLTVMSAFILVRHAIGTVIDPKINATQPAAIIK
jgi:hypothetical protein